LLKGSFRATFAILGAILLGATAAAVAGEVSDHLGRKPVLYVSIGLAVAGTAGIGFAPTLLFVGVYGALVAVGFGAFQAVNWALLSDDIPEGEGAKYFGLANLATSTYQLTFSLAALAALASIIPLRRITSAGDGEQPAGSRPRGPLAQRLGLPRRHRQVS
jgi:MFS family permease